METGKTIRPEDNARKLFCGIGKVSRDTAEFEKYYHISGGNVNKMICGECLTSK
jgi:hypothetical protein